MGLIEKGELLKDALILVEMENGVLKIIIRLPLSESKFEVEISTSIIGEDIIEHLIKGNHIPRFNSLGDLISYQIYKNTDPKAIDLNKSFF